MNFKILKIIKETKFKDLKHLERTIKNYLTFVFNFFSHVYRKWWARSYQNLSEEEIETKILIWL